MVAAVRLLERLAARFGEEGRHSWAIHSTDTLAQCIAMLGDRGVPGHQGITFICRKIGDFFKNPKCTLLLATYVLLKETPVCPNSPRPIRGSIV